MYVHQAMTHSVCFGGQDRPGMFGRRQIAYHKPESSFRALARVYHSNNVPELAGRLPRSRNFGKAVNIVSCQVVDSSTGLVVRKSRITRPRDIVHTKT